MVKVSLLLLNVIKGFENQGKLFKETPRKPWVFTILHKILPTGKQNLFLSPLSPPQTLFYQLSERKNISMEKCFISFWILHSNVCSKHSHLNSVLIPLEKKNQKTRLNNSQGPFQSELL